MQQPTPDEALRAMGATVRALREARGLTQQKAAQLANVSRAHLAQLERGGNVTVKFLIKVARFFDVPADTLDGIVQLTGGHAALRFAELLQSLDLLTALAEHLRGLAVQAVLPHSEAGKQLKDTLATRQFMAKHLGDEEALDRLAKAILHLSEDSPSAAAPPRSVGEKRETARRARSRER